jgi:hypothetical protein
MPTILGGKYWQEKGYGDFWCVGGLTCEFAGVFGEIIFGMGFASSKPQFLQ